MPNPVLLLMKARAPAEWCRIRPRVTIDQDGDEIVRGIRDLSFVAKVARRVIVSALAGGEPGIPPLKAQRAPGPHTCPANSYWWVYLDDLMDWRRAYTGKTPACTQPFDPARFEAVHNKCTPSG